MRSVSATMLGLALGATAAFGFAGTAAAQQKGEILIGEQCDRTGPTQIVGIRLCAAIQDYINLVNSKGAIVRRAFLGDTMRYWVKVDDREWIVDQPDPGGSATLDGPVSLSLRPDRVHVIAE